MAYEHQTKQAILQRMLDASPEDIDKRQGSVTHDLLSPAAIELALTYVELDQVLQAGFADTSYGEYLDKRCGELGIYRKQAVKAVGSVAFSGPSGTSIPKGTELATAGPESVSFVTKEAGMIPGESAGTVVLAAEAVAGGASGNVRAGAISLIRGNLAGILTVTNEAAFDGGTDRESDAAYLQRYLDRVRKPSTSGNAHHYEQWAKEVPGIAAVKVFPQWNGPLTVKVVVLDDARTAPPVSKVEEVAAYIESVRPIGAQVTVEAATETPIHVSAGLTLVQGASMSQAQAQIEEGLQAYLKTLAFLDPIVRYAKIANVILEAPAVLDYSDLTVNGGATNIAIDEEHVAVLGTVNLHA
ncbi:baseplate J protein [Xylanibacillus composti]|uniref:Baseplate J/gp47 family protein n=1 Tax=Xylanibacillus composti TaxID=1572762 RepID=A0A8J4H6R8_9BACL|nr:baseplate J/gp47 family protein [Xylanibacillus composti]MDT9725086.1 baseplate J protein [Xylanibacillus composti]GIQ70901.1 hypothetical protein XYCOK13_37250 [Xylanibacillus composti]